MTVYNTDNEAAQIKQVACLRKKAVKKLEGAIDDIAALRLVLDAPGCESLNTTRRLLDEKEIEAKLSKLRTLLLRDR